MVDPLDVCAGCPCEKPCLVPRGEPKEIAIVVDWPTQAEGSRERFFTSEVGKQLRRMFAQADVNLKDVYITSALNCRPNQKKEAMIRNAMQACRKRLIAELREAGVKKVLCLGSVGFSQLMSEEKVLPVTRVRGRWRTAYGMNILCTLPPRIVFQGDPDYYRDMAYDVVKFTTTDGAVPYENIQVEFPTTVPEMRKAMEEFYSCLEAVAVDTETTGFSSHSDHVLAIGVSGLKKDGQGGYCVVLDEALLSRKATAKAVSKLLSSDVPLAMHNAKFDLKMLRNYLESMGQEYLPNAVEDTMLLHYCQDERPIGRFGSHSLKTLGRVRYDAPDYDIDMDKWLKEWSEADDQRKREMRHDMHVYLACDCYLTSKLFADLPAEIEAESPGLLWLYDEILMPACIALADVEYHGVYVDRKFYLDTQNELAARAAPVLHRIRAHLGIEEFNPNSPQQLAKYLYDDLGLPILKTARRGKLQEGKTSKAVLKMLKKEFPEHEEFLDDILEYRTLTKTAGTYVDGILKRVDDDDRVRGDFVIPGTATGRISSQNPNLQNIPESSHIKLEVRNGFVAPKGMLLIEADYSQLELRVAAHLCDDDNFCQVFIDERDVHQEVAFSLFGKPAEEITKYERYMAKCVNFGVAYDRGARSIALGPEMEYVEEIGGERWSVEKVKEFFDDYFSNFPDYHVWREEQRRAAYTQQYIESPLGHRRRFPYIRAHDAGAVGRQGINTPVQGTAAYFTLRALTAIHQRLGELSRSEGVCVAHVVSTVHDSILIEVLEEWVDVVLQIVKEEMEDNVPLESRVPFKSDADVAPRWGQMGKWSREDEFDVVQRELTTD